MKLFLISQSANGGYDTYDSAVVAAADAEAARRTHPSEYYPLWRDEHPRGWFGQRSDGSTYPEGLYGTWARDIKDVDVVYLGEAHNGVEAGVICASFNAG